KDLDTTSLGAVVVGPVANPSNQTDLVASIQSATGTGVSAVRGVDQSAGRIATVFALLEQLNDKFGSYGTVPGSTPLPTPSP
ncbi:MAG: copper transporter, partial [Frankiaceae bacterium]|nr:copper transporter [Frankiaceae bacterium]